MSFANFWKFSTIISLNVLCASNIFSFFFPSETLMTWVLDLPRHRFLKFKFPPHFYSLLFIFDTFHWSFLKFSDFPSVISILLLRNFFFVTVFFNSKIPIGFLLCFFPPLMILSFYSFKKSLLFFGLWF